jgi:hypothetical protein
MIGMTLRVEMADGETFEAPITYGVACRWEDHHPTLSVGRFLEDMKFKPLAWLAWDALRTKKIVVPLFSTWVENVMDITFVPKAKQGPQEEPQT